MKYVNDCKAQVTRVIDEWIDEETGIKHRQVSKNLTDEPIELGSINKPQNTDIINITITVPRKLKGSGMIDFSKLFG